MRMDHCYVSQGDSASPLRYDSRRGASDLRGASFRTPHGLPFGDFIPPFHGFSKSNREIKLAGTARSTRLPGRSGFPALEIKPEFSKSKGPTNEHD